MRQAVFFTALCLASNLLFTNKAMAVMNTKGILKAIANEICYENFWDGNQFYRYGSTVSIALHQVDDVTYAWGDSLYSTPSYVRWTASYMIYKKGDNFIAESVPGYNIKDESAATIFRQKLLALQTATPINVKMKIPADCTPHFQPDTPEKIQMLNKLTKSVADAIDAWQKLPYYPEKKTYPNPLKIIIANFNLDYPGTHILIPATREVLGAVFLADSQNPFNQSVYDDYQVVPVIPNEGETYEDVYRGWSPQIEKYGIVREINLAGK